MAWIEMHQSLRTHDKTLVLTRLLGLKRYEVIGMLVSLWLWALDIADINGKLGNLIEEDIEEALGWKGDTGALSAALIESGFIDRLDGALVLHNWYKYAGKLNERREADRKRKAVRIPQEIHRNSGGVPALPHPHPTVPHDTEDTTTTDERARLLADATKELIEAYGRYFDADNAKEIVTGLVNDFGYWIAHECIHTVGQRPAAKRPMVPARYIREMCVNKGGAK